MKAKQRTENGEEKNRIVATAITVKKMSDAYVLIITIIFFFEMLPLLSKSPL